ncbi:hypothetical protein MHN79_07870 [Vibrio sp. Of14-4]|uniref:hypothetical protein n=1 Tax=Vibrio sp. Of14-4 TaxID=2724878 RepID=UPI001EF31F85|nr:hypothetical protein [Vibrio sp. Of14-4]MCG7489405.1 hypothetical protein [Vibrio sp. Of14-4]
MDSVDPLLLGFLPKYIRNMFFPYASVHSGKTLGYYVLLEIKTNAEHESDLSKLVATCPLRPSRHSKYVNGIRQLMWF